MQYLLLIYDNQNDRPQLDADAQGAMMAEYFAFNDELKAKERFVAGDALEPVSTARSVRTRDGKTLVTDGPFAETKEQLGGYYLINADSMAEAEAWAAKIPAARTGTVEVRPLMVFPGQ